MSRILVDQVRSNSASGDAITLDGSGKCAINATTINSLTFPTSDGSADQIIKTNGSGALSFTTPAVGGLTMVEQWVLEDEVTVSSAQTYNLTGTWAKRSQNGSGTIGASGMSVSSGIFTFPSTGVYKVDFLGRQRNSYGTGRRRVQSQIYTTHDNSTYIQAAVGGGNLSNRGSTTSVSDVVSIIFDVQNTSNYKVNFRINFSNEGRINARSGGDTTSTCAIFMKLGDT